MKPMEAWCVISSDLNNLYKIRREMDPNDKGYTDAEVEAEVICFNALQEAEKNRIAWVRKHPWRILKERENE